MDERWRSALENLPVGWRFRPYDEEVLDCYLKRKLTGGREAAEDGFDLNVIELNKYDPRDLIAKFKHGSRDKEMYFFSPCEYYKNGSLRKRKAGGGYWKSTGETRPVTLDDSGNVIGTKRSLVFHDPDSTNFIITEYRYTAPLLLESESESESPRDKFVICKLKVKPNTKKIMTRKSKQAAPDCENTTPKKKARKANLVDSNRASTTAIQNAHKTFTSSACGEHEFTNHMASHLHEENIDKSTDTKESHDHREVTAMEPNERELMASFVHKPPSEITAVSCKADCYFEKQFPVEKTDNSSNDNGAYDLEKCISASAYNQNECHNINVSIHEDCKSSSISCKVGDTASKTETQYTKDISVHEDDTGSLISCKAGDTDSKVETLYMKDIPVLEDDTGPLMAFSLDEIEFPEITLGELEEILAFPGYSLDIGTQVPDPAEDNRNAFAETPDGFVKSDKPET